MDEFEAREKIKKLGEKITEIEYRAMNDRRNLTAEEDAWIAEAQGSIEGLKKFLPGSPVTIVNFSRGTRSGLWDSAGEFFQSVWKAGLPGGKIDPRLYNAATGLSETVPSEGGFLVEHSLSQEILQDAFEYGLLAKRCRHQPIGANANGIKINGVDETSRATGSRFGGLRSYWLSEADEKTASKPKFRQIDLSLKKNIVLVYCTDELLADAVALEAFLREACPQEIAFSTDDAIINGTGAGMPLGIMNAGSLVTVSKESGQSASTIVAENIIKMVSRSLGSTSNYVWLYNKTCLQQIYSLSLSVGTGGVPLFIAGGSISNQPENRLLGLPLIECEQCQALGTTGDLILADLGNGYIVGDKGEVRGDVSIHIRFVYDESVFRFVYRVDGQPVRASALTPYKGGSSNTQSHFIALETRS